MSEASQDSIIKRRERFNAGMDFALSLAKARIKTELIELNSMPDRADKDFNEGYERGLKMIEFAVEDVFR